MKHKRKRQPKRMNEMIDESKLEIIRLLIVQLFGPVVSWSVSYRPAGASHTYTHSHSEEYSEWPSRVVSEGYVTTTKDELDD
jgi:hypothetical protein